MNKSTLTKYRLKLSILGINLVENNDWAIKTFRTISGEEYYGYIDVTDKSGFKDNFYNITLMDHFIIAQDSSMEYFIKTKGKPIYPRYTDKEVKLLGMRPLECEAYKTYEVIAALDAVQNRILVFNRYRNLVIFDINVDKYLSTLNIDMQYNAKIDKYMILVEEVLYGSENFMDTVLIEVDTDFESIKIKNDKYKNIIQEH